MHDVLHVYGSVIDFSTVMQSARLRRGWVIIGLYAEYKYESRVESLRDECFVYLSDYIHVAMY